MRVALYHHSAHVPEGKLSPPLRACVICGALFATRPIARIQQSPDVHLLYCPDCHACSASRMPTAEALNEYYASYFRGAVQKVTHDSPERFARHIATFVGATKRHVGITDFGGGDGTLAYRLAQVLCNRGWSSAEVTVVDYGQPRMSHDDRITIRSARPDSAIPPSDVILASAVLEHLPDPLLSITQVLEALNPGGVLYVRTPAVAGFMRVAGMLGQKLDFTFPAHLHDLGQDFWENILSRVPAAGEYEILRSAPSLVETDFRQHPGHTLAAHIAKSPWRLLGRRYSLVGGWEIVFRRK